MLVIFKSWIRGLSWWFRGFLKDSAGKESACNAGHLGLIPGLGRSSGEGNGYPLQNSGLENSMDCIVHGVTNGQTGLSDFHFDFLVVLRLPWWLSGRLHLPMQWTWV